MISTGVPDTITDLLATHNSQSPQPPQGWSDAGASNADIKGLGDRLGKPIPNELAAWLSFRDGCFIGAEFALDCLRIEADAANLAIRRDQFPKYFGRHPAGIPVASDGCGSHYILNDTGSVYFSDHEGPWYVVASSLWQFLACWIESELIRLRDGNRPWPFDEAWTTARDPELHKIPNNPWFRR